MYVVTFYSYQGGVGRTTALVNVGADLALRGRKVLLVDFDLNKPALASFGPLKSAGQRPGLVEFIAKYLQTGQAPDVKEYAQQVQLDETTECSVWLMPAGRGDDNYWAALARLNWQDLYSVRDGFLFLEDLKAQWRDILQVDYVLLDAAAGITDTTGICTRQLADHVVFFLLPDGSELAGAERVMKEVFTESIAEGPRRIDIDLVTSKVLDLDGEELPGAHQLGALLEPDWTVSATTGVGMMFELTAELPHDTLLLQERQVVMVQRQRSRLAHQYRLLANTIIMGNYIQDREGGKAFLKKLQQHPDWVVGGVMQGDTEERWYDHTRKLEQIIDRFTAKRDEHDQPLDPVAASRDAEMLGQAASCFYLAGSRVRAAEVLDVALDQSPHDSTLLWQRVSYRLKGGDRRFVDDLLTLLGPPGDQTPTTLVKRTPEEISRLLDRFQATNLERLVGLSTGSQLSELDTEAHRHDVLPLETVSGIDSYLVSAARLLRREAPQRLEEALQRSRVRKLSQADQDRLMSESMYPDQDPEWLIRWKHFREVIACLGPTIQEVDEPDVVSAFHLAMAYWAVGEEDDAIWISWKALKPWLAGGVEQLLGVFDATDPKHLTWVQMFALLAFRAYYGEDILRIEAARELATRLVGDLGEQFEGTNFFSYWRYRPVRFSQFREDCRDLLQMIQQRIANVSFSVPPFLSKTLSGV